MSDPAKDRIKHIASSVEWDKLLQAISEQRCVLFLGPELIPGTRLFEELCVKLDVPNNKNISIAFPEDELFLFPNPKSRSLIGGEIEDFFNKQCLRFAAFYEKVAKLPFHLIVSATPDMGISQVFDNKGIPHQFSYYNGKKIREDPPYDKIEEDPQNTRLIFNLFGRTSRLESLVLSHEDLFHYLQNILGGKSLSHPDYEKLPSAIYGATHFLFLGFQFRKWYMQLLLRLLNPEQNIGRQYALNPDLADETLVYYGGQFEIEFVDSHTPQEFLDELLDRWQESTVPNDQLEPLRQRLRNWHKQNQFRRILEKLESLPSVKADKELDNSVAMLQNQLTVLTENRRKGIIANDEALLQQNIIAHSLLELINQITE